jgi:glycosyltransferase involved in cell wall biosynthesis
VNDVLRVLHVIRSDAFAGVERHVANLAAGQADAGHRVRVVGGDVTAMRAVLGGHGVPVSPATTTTGAALASRRVSRSGTGPDVVHAHMTAAELAAALVPTLRGVPLVATRHFARRRGSSPLARRVGAVVGARIDAQVAISRYVAERIDGPSTVVYPGVPLRDVATGPRRPVVLVVQRLEPEKCTDVAVRAFAASGLATRGWTLEVAGDGSQRQQLEELAGRLGIWASTRFLGARPDCPELMDEASVLIAPCAVDGLGLSVLEAMSGGLCVVAAAAGGHLETAGRAEAARLFEPGAPDDAARLLRAVADDPAAARAHGLALRAVQREHFTLDAQVAGTLAVYRAVLDDRARRAPLQRGTDLT